MHADLPTLCQLLSGQKNRRHDPPRNLCSRGRKPNATRPNERPRSRPRREQDPLATLIAPPPDDRGAEFPQLRQCQSN
jgi:hypothetical protein